MSNLMPRERKARVRWWPSAVAAVLCLAIGSAAGWAGRAVLQNEPILALRETLTRDAVVAFRTYVPEIVHPVEVKADQRPHLVQWLSKRVGEPVTVPDLTALGFQLMGGRVVPTDEAAPAALLMYDDAQGTRLTLYSRTGVTDRRTSFRYAREGDVAALSWAEGELSYVVAARIDERRLLGVAESINAQVRARSTATR